MSRRPVNRQGLGGSEPEEPYLWAFQALERFVRHEDPEVRAWAAGRMMQQFPLQSPDVLAGMVLDEPAAVGERVAEILAQHGSAKHVPLLERGLKHATGRVPGACLAALARLGHPGIEELAASRVRSPGMGEEGAAALLAALLRHGERQPARQVARAYLASHPAVMVDPDVARELFAAWEAEDYPWLVERFLAALAWAGAERAAPALRGVLDAVEVEDAGWLLHTDAADRIDIQRTMKAYDASYDVETRRDVGEEWCKRFRAAFADGSLAAVSRAVLEFCDERDAAGKSRDALRGRIRSAVAAFSSPEVLEGFERLGPASSSALVIALLSCALKLASFRSLRREMESAAYDLDRLLGLMEVESSALLDDLPQAISRAVRDEDSRTRAVRRAAQLLGRRGPLYGKVVALTLLGTLKAAEEAHEVIRCLHDPSDQVLESAGHALERMGPEVVASIHAAYEEGPVEPEELEWMVAAACQAGTPDALSFILNHLDELVAELGPGFVSEWAAVLGAEELIPRLRQMLDADLASVGRALLLVSAIHNQRVPEEERILHAIDHAHRSEDPDFGGGIDGGGSGGPYVM